MNQRESWKTWVIVFVLLIFAGIASATVPLILDKLGGDDSTAVTNEPTTITLTVEDLPLGEVLVQLPLLSDSDVRANIDGRQVKVWQAFGILFGIVLVSVGGLGLLLALIAGLLSKQINKVYADEGYQKAQVELSNRQKTLIKTNQESRLAATPPEAQKRAWRQEAVFSFIILIFVWIGGLIIGKSLFADATWTVGGLTLDPVTTTNIILVLVTVIILVLFGRSRRPGTMYSGETDNLAVNWGTIWVLLSGLLIVGVGTGLSIALRGG